MNESEVSVALELALNELHEINLARKHGNPPRNPEFTEMAEEKVRHALHNVNEESNAKVRVSDVGQVFMTGGWTERGVRSLELIADALQTLAKVESERERREIDSAKKLTEMNERIRRGAEVNRASDEKREAFSDKATDKWVAETEAALPKSRFEERLESERERAKEAVKK